MNKIKISFLAVSIFLLSYGISSAQDSFADIDPGNTPEAVAPPDNTIETVILVGNVSFFDDESLFNNTCPGLAVEDFEDTNIVPNSNLACPAPFNFLTNNACYSPGALIPGFSLSVAFNFDPALALETITPFRFGLTNVGVGAHFFDDNTVITFTEPVNAVGMVLVSADFIGNTTVDVQVFGGPGNVFLGSAIVNLTPANGTFLGVVAGGPITRIELVDGFGELLYELSFGSCDVSRPIPTISEWGLIAMAGILGIIGLLAIRRRKVTA